MSLSWHTLEYRLHARVGILHGTKPAVQLWYALRALDVNGSGKVVIPTGEVEVQLGKSKLTVRRYLMDTTFFRSYYIEGGMVTVYLQGLAAVCKALSFTDIGPIGFNEGLGQLVKDSALIAAQAVQQASLYLATHGQRSGKVHDVVDATKITTVHELMIRSSYITEGVTSASDSTASEDVIVDVPQCIGNLTINTVSGRAQPVHMLRLGTTIYGASLEGIAALLQVCSKTISRALQGTMRIRQAQCIPWWEYDSLRADAKETLRGISEDCKYPFYSKHKHLGPYRLYTYLYYPLHQLCSQRVVKSHVNPWLKGGAWGC